MSPRFSFGDNVLIVCNPLGRGSHAVFTQKSRGRENWGIRASDLPAPTIKRSCRPRTGLRSQQHCYFLLPVDHEALGQAHTNVLNYEAACDKCILVNLQRELCHVINRRITTTKRKMWRLCCRSKCKVDVKSTHYYFSQTWYKTCLKQMNEP